MCIALIIKAERRKGGKGFAPKSPILRPALLILVLQLSNQGTNTLEMA